MWRGIREKCKFPIVVNCWKIDYVEKICGVQRELHVEKKKSLQQCNEIPAQGELGSLRTKWYTKSWYDR